jgi:ATP/maltotriose-dependent transcriptional regulator MalT
VNAFDEARALWDIVVVEATERGDPECAVYLLDLAKMEVSAGRWEHAAEVCQEAISLSRQTGREITELLCQTVLAEIDTWRGEADPVEILGLVRQTEPPFSNFGVSHRLGRALSALHLSRDEPEAAWNYLVGRFDGVLPMVSVEAQLAGSVGVETLIRLGDLRSAAQMLVQVDAVASTADTAIPYLVHRCRGQLLAAQGDLEGAIAEFETELLEPEPPTQHQPLERARTLLALGRVHRQMQHKKLARETLQAALTSFEQLGARTWADQARGELRRIGGRTNSQEELSETEQRIVDLVVAGLKNREIAERLFLSPDTIAWNLSRVYRKYGVNSRTQLVARLAQASDERVDVATETT